MLQCFLSQSISELITCIQHYTTGEMEVVLDLSGHKLSKLEKAPSNRAFATALVLDDNCLQNLTNLDSYGELQRVS